MGGKNRCPPVHTFDYWYKELSRALAGKKEAGCHVNTCGFLHVFTAFRWVLVLYSRNKLLRQCGAKNIPGGQAMCSKR